jgi:hypothetical protein
MLTSIYIASDTTLDRIESHFGMNSWGTDYNIVATLGTPMSGKSMCMILWL